MPLAVFSLPFGYLRRCPRFEVFEVETARLAGQMNSCPEPARPSCIAMRFAPIWRPSSRLNKAGRRAAGRERLVATLTSMPLRYDPAHLEAFRGWDAVTNRGYLFPDMEVARCNAI